MNELELILSVTTLFLLRIGLPLMVMVGVAMFLDRWQSRHTDIHPHGR